MRIILLVFSIVIVISSCMKHRNAPQAELITQRSQPAVVPRGTDTMLYYSRGACFGMCPIFDFTLMKDGRAIYNGKNHVDRVGRYQALIDITEAEKVLRKANEIGYFQLKTEYDNPNVHDLPDIITGIAHEGHLHRVRNRYKGPAALRMVYAELDSLIARQSWSLVGVPNAE
jgi:hypothetical protein